MLIMRYINFIVYVQRQINKILRSIKDFTHIYINNIVIDLKDLLQHVVYLRQLFKLLMRYNITIASTKIFLNYLNINLLNRRINLFDITTIENKLKIISEIIYLATLGDLEHYLNLIDYLRSSIYYYAQLISSL